VAHQPPHGGFLLLLLKSTKGEFMSFFKHVALHEYDLTNKGISQACYDELVASGNNSNENQLRILADSMREEFKDYMRPLFQ
tara:strand:+ start:107 stop:352 length:246 start_codon:yes stop_codon:yes gene_type:complete